MRTLFGIILALFCTATFLEAKDMNALSSNERNLAAIAANTARGDMANLKTALNKGLDEGLSVNEIKEVLTQLYAYCGFPRSLNALGNFMGVVQERAAKGIKDNDGKLPGPLPAGKSIDFGTANQTKLCGREVKGALFEFAPAIDFYLKAHLFGDIFGRDNLDWKTREIATIAALAALPGADSQLKSHIGIGKHNGVTDEQVREILALVAQNEYGVPRISDFPVGQENSAYAKYFSGKSYLARLAKDERLNVPVANVTFEPGCRNNWHIHHAKSGGGQLLLCTDGLGWYQEAGKRAQPLHPGDVVTIPAGVKHWHGAQKDCWFSHIAIECPGEETSNEWLEPVTDAEYAALDAGCAQNP